MTEVYLLYKGNQHSNLGIKLTDPIVREEFHLARWSTYGNKSKIGDIIKLILKSDDGITKKENIVKITSMKRVENFEDIIESDLDSWIKFIQINEFRENQIDKIIK